MSDDDGVGPRAEPTQPADGPDSEGPGQPAAVATEVAEAPAPKGARHSSKPKRKPGSKGSFWRELPVLLVIALVLALVIKAFLVQAFYIPSGSMENTLQINDRVLVNKLVYDFRDVRRGEIIVFDADGSLAPDLDQRVIAEPGNPVSKLFNKISTTLGFGVPPGEQDYIKRVIGVGGDRVMCCDAQGRVTVTPKGGSPVALDEPYVFQDDNMVFCEAGVDDAATCPPGAKGVLVPDGRLFVMGDHRNASSDSRVKFRSYFTGNTNDGTNGTVSEDLVIGRAFVVVWPLDRLDWLSVPDLFSDPVSMEAAPYVMSGISVLPLAFLRRRRRHRQDVPADA
jgi:signal peptidase I